MTLYLDQRLVDLLLQERLCKAAERRRSQQLRRAGGGSLVWRRARLTTSA